MFKNAVEKQ